MQQYEDNLRWLDGAGKNRLVVGSQARILYSDQEGRAAIAELRRRGRLGSWAEALAGTPLFGAHSVRDE